VRVAWSTLDSQRGRGHTRWMEREADIGRSGVVPDTRGEGRALRATWHHDADCVVLSVWRGNVCTATVRLHPEDVPALVDILVSGLAEVRPGTQRGHQAAG
jgi:hypothetical protein